MDLSQLQRDHQACLEQAAALLGTPVRPVGIDWDVEKLLRRHLRLEQRVGFDRQHPFLWLSGGPKGQKLQFGLERYRLELPDGTLPLARILAPCADHHLWNWYQFWAVPVDLHFRLYRFLRRLERQSLAALPPLMRAADQARLWQETIGFLRFGRKPLEMYGVAQKRGVMLLGAPGNGKTMACRWLLSQCHRHGLRWRSVSAEEFAGARECGGVRELFELDGPGVILFDDFDTALRDQDGNESDRTTFLTELDGLHPRDGVVYLFTSNARPSDLHPAFRRPGRIDLFLNFARPDADLRRRFVVERWHADVVGALDPDTVVAETEGFSFAELDELKKLLVLGFLETNTWDWDGALAAYRHGRDGHKPQHSLGFQTPSARSRPGGDGRVTVARV